MAFLSFWAVEDFPHPTMLYGDDNFTRGISPSKHIHTALEGQVTILFAIPTDELLSFFSTECVYVLTIFTRF